MAKKRTSDTNGTNNPKHDPNSLLVVRNPDEEFTVAFARAVITPEVQAALTIREYGKGLGTISVMGLIDELRSCTAKVESGDLTRQEAILTQQATALDGIFNNLARRAALNMGEYTATADLYLRLALKAQSQCRSTIETLAEIKFPKSATFIKQANVAGVQQINNGGAAKPELKDNYARTPAPAHTEDLETSQNKLLETTHGQPLERLDTRTPETASADHQQLETVATIDRAHKP